jgi:hypothetical protein
MRRRAIELRNDREPDLRVSDFLEDAASWRPWPLS